MRNTRAHQRHAGALRGGPPLLLLAILAPWAACCAALAPESPTGMVYYQSETTLARTGITEAGWLQEGGRYHGLFLIAAGLGLGAPTHLANAQDGTWSYRKIDDATAELTITTEPGRVARRLRFTSDTEGFSNRLDFSPGILTGGSFRLALPGRPLPLINCSNRSFVRAGSPALAGFVITEAPPRAYLIRAVGPGLGQFRVTGALSTPALSIIAVADQRVVARNAGWSAPSESAPAATLAIRRTSALVGAFPLPEPSLDAATVVHLGPGAYIAEAAAGSASDEGQVLVEVYTLP